MENTENSQNSGQISITDGIILPSGPPLTPQLTPFVAPPISQVGTLTPAQMQNFANAQIEAQNKLNTMTQNLPLSTTASTTQHFTGTPLQPATISASGQSAQKLPQVTESLRQAPTLATQVMDPNNQLHTLHQIGIALQSPNQTAQTITSQGIQSGNPFAQLVNPTSLATLNNMASPMTLNNPIVETNQLAPVNLQQHGLLNTPALQNQTFTQIPQGMDNSSLAAYFTALSNQTGTSNLTPQNNALSISNGVIMTPTGPQLLSNTLQNQQQLVINGNLAALASAAKISPQISGQRAYELLAIQLTKKAHTVKTDLERMKHLKAMKLKLVGKVFKPLDWRYASNYKKLERLPGWHSAANKEKLRVWGLRGAELFRQTLLLEIEGEMLKVKVEYVVNWTLLSDQPKPWL